MILKFMKLNYKVNGIELIKSRISEGNNDFYDFLKVSAKYDHNIEYQ